MESLSYPAKKMPDSQKAINQSFILKNKIQLSGNDTQTVSLRLYASPIIFYCNISASSIYRTISGATNDLEDCRSVALTK
jgi:hypothetical protein